MVGGGGVHVGAGHIGAGFPGGAQGFTGGAQRIPPRAGSTFKEVKTPSAKEELEGVNRCVRRLHERYRKQRECQAQDGHDFQSNKPKSSLLVGALEGVKSTPSDLEKFLQPRLGGDATPFDPRVREHVKKEFPEFYRKYTPETIVAALRKHDVNWFV